MTSEFWQYFRLVCHSKDKQILVYFHIGLECDTPILEALFHTSFAFLVIDGAGRSSETGAVLFTSIQTKLKTIIDFEQLGEKRTALGRTMTAMFELSWIYNEFTVTLALQAPHHAWTLKFCCSESMSNKSYRLRYNFHNLKTNVGVLGASVGCNFDAIVDPYIAQIVEAFKQ
jgi:hypothetical protein